MAGVNVLFDFLEARSPETAERYFRYIDNVIYVLAVFLVSKLVVREVTAALEWYGKNVLAKGDSRVSDEFVPLFDRVVTIVVYLLGALIVLEHFEIDIKGLIAVLGVGSLAIALAAQETIANMIGGFVIMIDRPFRVGDRLRLGDGAVCIVQQIGIRSTKFLTFDNTLIIIPNAELMKSTVHNLTYPEPLVRFTVEVGVGYDSDIERVRRAMLSEAERHPRVLKDPAPLFFFLGFGDSSLNVSMRCAVADVAEAFAVESELREGILARFRNEGIEIPFPQRVVTVKKSGETNLPA
ncbi:MAG: mechanosensitive ion channel [Chitinivibrionia bacterium]|nr:mechanosensitive ion channel [Chitinivibrionia bacterium]